MTRPIALGLLLIAAGAVHAQDAAVDPILAKVQSLRPSEKELAIYRLTWVATLKEARERAAREGRPVLLLVCTNSYGNLFTGHC